MPGQLEGIRGPGAGYGWAGKVRLKGMIVRVVLCSSRTARHCNLVYHAWWQNEGARTDGATAGRAEA